MPAEALVPARRGRRRRLRTAWVVTHRWLSLVLRLLLVVITTTGAILVYEPEISRALNPIYDRATGPAVVSLADAVEIVQRERPDFDANTVIAEHGVYRVVDVDWVTYVAVDPGSGRVIGEGEISNAFFGAMEQVHLCFFSCEGMPWYASWMMATVPGLGEMTWGGFLLGVSGLLLLVLAITGIWVWWPRGGRWKHATRVRLKNGRFARDHDLHQVAGMVAIPLLLLWAVTGAGFEFPFVSQAWFAATPGEATPESQFTSEPGTGEDLASAAALAAAQVAARSDRAVALTLPLPDDETSAYSFWFTDGLDPYAHTDYPGDLEVHVGRREPNHAAVTWAGPGTPMATAVWKQWNYPTHAGYVVNGWWRIPWFVLGLAPLLLMVTGLSTWFCKRGVRKRRKTASAKAIAAP